LPVPVFAIGGIDGERIDELVGLGLTRIAVAAAVTAVAEPALAVQALLAALGR
jgi:thiamine-phosphate pyrophosphorylase